MQSGKPLRHLLLCLLCIVGAPAFAQTAALVGEVLVLPIVLVDGVPYEVELRLQGTNPQLFRVTKANPFPHGGTAGVATFNFGDQVLRIPSLRAAGNDYDAQLTLQNVDTLVFRVDFVKGLNGAADAGAELPRTLANVVQGVAALPDARGGINYEPVAVDAGFDKAASLTAFRDTLYPLLRSSTCIACHNSAITAGAQAPLHTDSDVELAHEYALTRVNFADPVNS